MGLRPTPHELFEKSSTKTLSKSCVRTILELISVWGDRMPWALILTVSWIVSFFLHIFIHEVGHLIGGLISGYKLVSFRLGSFTLARQDGKLRWKRYSLGDTGGQCLMSPPEVANEEEYKFPFMLYNLGGSFANFDSAIIALIIAVFTTGYISMIFASFGVMGIACGLINIIPMKLGGIANDGLNALNFRESADIRRAIWIQLKYAEMVTQGIRAREIPEDWVTDIETPIDPITGFLPCLRFDYLCDRGEYEQAREYAEEILRNPGKMMVLHRNELRCSILFFELVGECNKGTVERMYTKKLQKHMKLYKTLPSTMRVKYAYEKYYKRDDEKAKKALAAFEKACLQSPFPGAMISEREMIDTISIFK